MLAIRAGRAFDGERVVHGGAFVVLDEGRIAGIEPARTAAPDGCQVLDFPAGTVLPGLIDMHVHLCADGMDGALDRLEHLGEDELADVVTAALDQHLRAGVTTVRDLGDRRYIVVDRRASRAVHGDLANLGGVAEPTVLTAGPPITIPGGHCWNMGGETTGPEELRAAVRDRADHGVDVVKIMASGGAMTAGTDILACQFTVAELRLVVEEAHALGLPVTAHAHGLPAVERAVEAGVDGIEHCSCLTPNGIEVPDRLLEKLAASRIAVCPTLGRTPGAPYAAAMQELMDRTGFTWQTRCEQFARMHAAGVTVVSGGDAGISSAKPHGILPGAIADLVDGGMPVPDALTSATARAADAAGVGDHTGRLRRGYVADLIVVDGDPTTDIGALRRVAAVIRGGHRVI